MSGQAAQLRVVLRIAKWRIRVAFAVINALSLIEWARPGSVNEEWWTDRLSDFIVRGIATEVANG